MTVVCEKIGSFRLQLLRRASIAFASEPSLMARFPASVGTVIFNIMRIANPSLFLLPACRAELPRLNGSH
jgi:hypothetical protein